MAVRQTRERIVPQVFALFCRSVICEGLPERRYGSSGQDCFVGGNGYLDPLRRLMIDTYRCRCRPLAEGRNYPRCAIANLADHDDDSTLVFARETVGGGELFHITRVLHQVIPIAQGDFLAAHQFFGL